MLCFQRKQFPLALYYHMNHLDCKAINKWDHVSWRRSETNVKSTSELPICKFMLAELNSYTQDYGLGFERLMFKINIFLSFLSGTGVGRSHLRF